jgi:hypothetical protein
MLLLKAGSARIENFPQGQINLHHRLRDGILDQRVVSSTPSQKQEVIRLRISRKFFISSGERTAAISWLSKVCSLMMFSCKSSALIGEADQDGAPVFLVGFSCHQAAPFQPIYKHGQGSRGDAHFRGEFRHAQVAGSAENLQGRHLG